MSDLLLGVDIGTTSVKAVLVEATSLNSRAESSVAVPSHRNQDRVEQDPSDWTAATAKAWQAIQGAVGDDNVIAIGVCSQVNTHVFVDETLAPTRGAIVWQDRRAVAEAVDLADQIPEALHQAWWPAGFTIDASFGPARFRWVQRHEPDVWRRTAHVLMPKDFVVAALCGTLVSDPLSAVGLVDGDGHYLEGLLELVDDARRRLPPLEWFDVAAGRSTGNLGLPAGVPVAVGTMDAWAAIFGSGAVEPGIGFDIAGTSEVVGTVSTTPGAAPGIITFPPVRGRYIHTGPTQVGAAALGWLARVFVCDITQLLAEVEATTPPHQPLILLPHLEGERAPHWNPLATGALVGMTLSMTRADVVRATLEGVAFAARQILELCESAAGAPCGIVHVSGGGGKSAFWNQLKADALNRPVATVSCLSSAAVGAALTAGAAAGREDVFTASRRLPLATTFTPDGRSRAAFDDRYGLFRSTYQHVEGLFEEYGRRDMSLHATDDVG